MLHLLLAVSLSSPLLQLNSNTVTLAWDTPFDPTITGYMIFRGDPPCESTTWPDGLDVGNRSVYTWSSPKIDLNKSQCFTALSYDADGNRSDYAAPLLVSPQLGGIQPDTCSFPEGANAILLSAGRVVDTTGKTGSRLSVQFQIASPNSKVNKIDIILGATIVKTVTGDDMVDVGAIYFIAPVIPDTYPLTVQVSNLAGCSSKLAVGADGQFMRVTVK